MPVTLEAWRAYALERGDNKPTDATEATAKAALVRASDYIKYRYVAFFCNPENATLLVVDEATSIIAAIELAQPGFFTRTYTPSDQKILTEVKGIKWTVTGEQGAMAATPVSTLVHDMLLPYYCGPDAPKKPRGAMVWAVG